MSFVPSDGDQLWIRRSSSSCYALNWPVRCKNVPPYLACEIQNFQNLNGAVSVHEPLWPTDSVLCNTSTTKSVDLPKTFVIAHQRSKRDLNEIISFRRLSMLWENCTVCVVLHWSTQWLLFAVEEPPKSVLRIDLNLTSPGWVQYGLR